jgi:hypothetical protein
LRERNETRDPAQESRSAIHSCRPGSRVSLRSPGTRWSRETPHVLFSRCQTAQRYSFPRCVVAPGFSLFLSRPPQQGVGGAPTGALCLLSRVRSATDPHPPGCGAPHDAGRSPLGAPPWRFSAGGRASISGISSGSVQRAPRSQVIMPGGRCPGPPEPAVTSRGRRTPLPAPPSGSFLENAPSERGWESLYHNFST